MHIHVTHELISHIQVGNQCHCGNQLYSNLFTEGCDSNCPGNSCERCGGISRLSLFDTRLNDSGCSGNKCKNDQTCKEDSNGYICINDTASKTLNCLYNDSTTSLESTVAPSSGRNAPKSTTTPGGRNAPKSTTVTTPGGSANVAMNSVSTGQGGSAIALPNSEPNGIISKYIFVVITFKA
ncbi:uncharacterized protein LOC132760237 [Ruditapes philippinarum]|uniref:uncharacterized protein LOC132760237 n=1 Tax=Ruditapes philippinarum TaxID=129788 RepID=UPI00295B95DF|nr:uncharacterized protein LOC132760237 [Ruditapes philippinarum]